MTGSNVTNRNNAGKTTGENSWFRLARQIMFISSLGKERKGYIRHSGSGSRSRKLAQAGDQVPVARFASLVPACTG